MTTRDNAARDRQLRDNPQHRPVAITLDGLAGHFFVPGAGHAIENYTADAKLRIKAYAPVYKSRQSACSLGGIHHQHHRSTQQLRKRCRAMRAVDVLTVENTAIAFNQGQIRPPGMAREAAFDGLFPNHKGVEVTTGAAGYFG